MNKRTLGVALIVAMAVSLFTVAGLYAGATLPDEIQMNSAYKHTKSLPVFSHKKHMGDYKIGCGECHHDDQGKSLTSLKEGDTVQKCFECHKKPGELKGKKAKGLSKEEKRMYHANAVHENCLGCHRTFNKRKKPRQRPPNVRTVIPRPRNNSVLSDLRKRPAALRQPAFFIVNHTQNQLLAHRR